MSRFDRLIGRLVVAAALVAAIAATVLAGVRPDLAPSDPAAPAQRAPKHLRVDQVAAIGITVGDLDRSVQFYTEVLGFEKLDESEAAGDRIERLTGVFGARCRAVRLQLGEECIELTQFLAPEGRPMPSDSRSNDHWFQHIALVVSDMERAYAHLRAHKVRHASSGPQTLPSWNQAAGGVSAFYFKDPDGHVLELIHFPQGKGDPKWHKPTESLILGIDHTAIVVADTERSVKFYCDALGMAMAGQSENYGTEQERLNNVFGARLRITTLRAPQGPGVELLEYLAPTDGRDYPPDARACDVLHWQTALMVADVNAAADRARGAGGRWISHGAIDGVGALIGIESAALVRDPDGHALLLAQPPGGSVIQGAPGPTTEEGSAK